MSNETIDSHLPQKEKVDLKKGSIQFGVIGGLASIIVSLILYFANLQLEPWAKWISSLVLIGAVILGIRAIAKQNQNLELPFGTLFGGGMLVTLIITIFTIAYFLFYIKLIEPDFVDKILDISRQQMAQKGLNDDQIEKAVEMSKKFMTPGLMVLFSSIGTLLIGAIASLIGAAIFKKEH